MMLEAGSNVIDYSSRSPFLCFCLLCEFLLLLLLRAPPRSFGRSSFVAFFSLALYIFVAMAIRLSAECRVPGVVSGFSIYMKNNSS